MSKFDALYEQTLNELVPLVALPALAATGTGTAAAGTGITAGGLAAAAGILAGAGKLAHTLYKQNQSKTATATQTQGQADSTAKLVTTTQTDNKSRIKGTTPSGQAETNPDLTSRRGLPTTSQGDIDQLSNNLVNVTNPLDVKNILQTSFR